MHEIHRAQLLEFLTPGFLHTLGNALFTIQGNAQTLGRAPDGILRQREEILGGCARTREALLVYRVIADPAPERDGVLLGSSLPVLIDMLRVSLRERGVLLRMSQPLRAAPIPVSRNGLIIGLIATCHAIERGLRGGFDREVGIRLQVTGSELDVEFQVPLAPAQLPFVIDLDPEFQTIGAALAESGLRLRAAPRGCAFRMPLLARAGAPDDDPATAMGSGGSA